MRHSNSRVPQRVRRIGCTVSKGRYSELKDGCEARLCSLYSERVLVWAVGVKGGLSFRSTTFEGKQLYNKKVKNIKKGLGKGGGQHSKRKNHNVSFDEGRYSILTVVQESPRRIEDVCIEKEPIPRSKHDLDVWPQDPEEEVGGIG